MDVPVYLICKYFLAVPPTVTQARNQTVQNVDRPVENGTGTVVAFNINRARPAVELKNIVWTFQHIGNESEMILEPSCTMQSANCSDPRYSRYNFSSDLQTLTIYSVRVADYGVFTLTASNPAGRSTETMSMNITGKIASETIIILFIIIMTELYTTSEDSRGGL